MRESNLEMDSIHVIGGSVEPITFAAAELRKYLRLVSGTDIQLSETSQYRADLPGIWVGLHQDFPWAPGLEYDEREDAVRIDVSHGSGIIAGSNKGSVLIAVYRYLQELGCRWVRPGTSGEFVPRVDYKIRPVKVDEKANCRFRGICLEGAVSFDNVFDMIDWLPKVGFNGYFIQFREAYVFFERWYHHLRHPTKQTSGKIHPKTTLSFVESLAAEIKKRGLVYHAVGHGWTSTALGVPSLSWDKVESEAAPEIAPYLAEVNGIRGWWRGVPIDTELCYSNSNARARMIDEIVKYAMDHPEVDMLHVWLSDGHNNQCECPNCVLQSPSDWYIALLNELDDALTVNGLTTRIAFLLYQELLWPPNRETLYNAERFVLMLAPITRTYRKSFAESGELPPLPPFVRNQIGFPLTIEDNLSYLKAWQAMFGGEGFDFDYHFMWAHQKDPGQVAISRMLYADIRHLREIGLHGYVSCQVQRAFFPNGLGVTVMGRALWDSTLSFEEIAADYFRSAYGDAGGQCLNYLTELSKLFDLLHLDAPFSTSEVGRNPGLFERIGSTLRNFKPVIEQNLSSPDACRSVSWMHLKVHQELWLEMTDALGLLYNSETEEARARWTTLKNRLWEKEEQVQEVLDVFNFVYVYDGIFGG
ncbi:DUF4838 domain-containing protein [Cohnella soli]|uniref:DUF4838 domain-containing protein n=1 Tax=Cohnella soli TaxID=425005 RepID=A0ABW0HVQ8_9BACL